MKCIILSYLVSATLCIYGGGALRDVRLHAPLAALRGHDVLFRCEFELEADTLYAVKWYRSDREFYRYAPRDQPAAKHFPLPTINVNMSSSDATHLSLMDVQRQTTGRYSCEVSADAPSFHTAQVWTFFHVAEVPTHNPIIKGMKPRYRIGSILKANCTSRNSFPAANLTWVINNGPANPSHVRLYQAVRGMTDLMTSITSIHFVVTPKHFVNGRLKVRCTAGIYNVYWKSTEKSASEERPPTAPPPAPPALESGRDALVYPVQESPLNASSCSRAPHFDLLISASICIVLGRIWNEDWPLSIGEM